MRGPLWAAALSLGRVGWTWTEPFKFTTDQGQVLEPTQQSPAMLNKQRKEARQRQAERELGNATEDPQPKGKRT